MAFKLSAIYVSVGLYYVTGSVRAVTVNHMETTVNSRGGFAKCSPAGL